MTENSLNTDTLTRNNSDALRPEDLLPWLLPKQDHLVRQQTIESTSKSAQNRHRNHTTAVKVVKDGNIMQQINQIGMKKHKEG